MCRSIKTLYNFDPPATNEEVQSAALQYVRKLSGFTKPSHMNEDVFNLAIQEISDASRKLLEGLVTNAEPKDRIVEAEKKRKRWEKSVSPNLKN